MRAKHRFRVRPGAIRPSLYSLCICLLLAGTAHAAVAVLLEQPYGGLGEVNPTGHAAIYLDHVCAETPLELRACHPGELGVVISRYDGIRGYDWVAVPLIPYLYSVERAADIPTSVDRVVADRLRDEYRRRHLEEIAPGLLESQSPSGNWYELVGSAFDRTIYGFQVDTTPEQDAALIALMNDRPNVERYNGAFRNCADFARVTLNRFYPHAVRRNFIADFGITTPKSVARGLTHYAHKHPGAHLRAFVIPQVRGELPRSHAVQGVTESLLKKYGLPLVVLSPTTTAVILAAYVEHGRFDMPRDAPELDVGALETAAMERIAAEAAPGQGHGQTPVLLTLSAANAPAAEHTAEPVSSPAATPRLSPRSTPSPWIDEGAAPLPVPEVVQGATAPVDLLNQP